MNTYRFSGTSDVVLCAACFGVNLCGAFTFYVSR